MTASPISSRQAEGEKAEAVTDFIFLGSKITADGDCSHEIKRRLFLGRKAVTNLNSTVESSDVSLLQRTVEPKLWFCQKSCMDVRVGL